MTKPSRLKHKYTKNKKKTKKTNKQKTQKQKNNNSMRYGTRPSK